MTREVTVRVSCDDLAEAMRLVASVSGRATARDGEAIATFTPDEASRVERICAKRGYACTISKGRGALSAAVSRIGLIVAAAALAVLLVVSQLFVTDVTVTGADTSQSARIAAIVAENGLSGVTLKSKIDPEALAYEIERELPDVTSVEAYFDGDSLAIAVVPIQEKPSAAQPGSEMVADARAVVTRVVVFSGTAEVKEGDVVAPGDVLISGKINIGTEEEPKYADVGADGIVYARVFESERLIFAPRYYLRQPTGRTYSAIEVSVGGKTIWRSGGEHGFDNYEARTGTAKLRGVVPIEITRTVYEEFAVVEGVVDEEYIAAAIAEKRSELMSRATGTILSEGVNRGEVGGYAYAEIYIETERQICRREV